jgi:hypothetical protein
MGRFELPTITSYSTGPLCRLSSARAKPYVTDRNEFRFWLLKPRQCNYSITKLDKFFLNLDRFQEIF